MGRFGSHPEAEMGLSDLLVCVGRARNGMPKFMIGQLVKKHEADLV